MSEWKRLLYSNINTGLDLLINCVLDGWNLLNKWYKEYISLKCIIKKCNNKTGKPVNVSKLAQFSMDNAKRPCKLHGNWFSVVYILWISWEKKQLLALWICNLSWQLLIIELVWFLEPFWFLKSGIGSDRGR